MEVRKMDLSAVCEVLKARGFSAVQFETKEKAVQYLAKECAGKTVAFGGSMTLEQMDAYEVVGQTAQVYWHWKGDGYCQNAETYVSSVNALAETGELVNIDGAGNRTAGTLYGSKQVFLVCGVNKIVPTLADALERAQNIAAPRNAHRLGRKTPCAATGGKQCYHCQSPENICRATVILHGPMLSTERYEIVLIDEELGY